MICTRRSINSNSWLSSLWTNPSEEIKHPFNQKWYFVHIIFCFLYEENIFSCEWLVFWVRSGENSVLKKEKFWITSLRVIPSFSFWNTLFSPRVSQKNSHEQVKIVFFMRQQKIMWTDYFFQFFHGAFQCVSRIVP